MAAFATLSISDGQTTPVAHSFTPGPKILLPDGSQRFSWYDLSVNSGVFLGANRLDMDVRMPRSQGNRASDAPLSVAYRFTLPTMETLSNNTASGIDPQPTKAYDTTVWVKIVRNGRSGQQPVKDALAFMRNFSSLAALTDTALLYAPPTS